MAKIYELETKNGRIYKVAINNDNQEKRLKKVIADNKKKSYETFIRVEIISKGLLDLKTFEERAKGLI